MKTTELETVCPYCGYQAELQSGLTSPTANPCENDFSLCVACGEIAQYTDKLTLRKVDLTKLSPEIKGEAVRAKCAWREARRRRNFSFLARGS